MPFPGRRLSSDTTRAMRRAGTASIGANIRAGADLYDRARDLPRLIRLDRLPDESVPAAARTAAIVGRLECALRAERQRARSGHWTYDLNRHIALHQAFVAESERLAALRRPPERDG